MLNRNLSTLLPLALAALAGCSSQTKEAAPVQPAAPVSLAPFAGEVGMGVSYLQTRATHLLEEVGNLVTAIESQNLNAAKRAYVEARAPYEEIQVMAPAFPELDLAIDGRAYEYPGGELSNEFRGFHRIEVFLFARNVTKPALPYALRLREDVEELQMVLADRSLYDAQMSFSGMIERCDQVASRMITSEEETWSEQTLLAIRHAWIGIHSQYRHFATDLRDKDVVGAERLDRAYRQALETIASHFPVGQTAGAPYSMIDARRRREIADATIRLRMHLIKAQESLGLAAN